MEIPSASREKPESEAECVYCAVRDEYLSIVRVVLKGLSAKDWDGYGYYEMLIIWGKFSFSRVATAPSVVIIDDVYSESYCLQFLAPSYAKIRQSSLSEP